jgi:anti-sigma regulatory factor (Ser/Thr protein kinase)/serine/threonine protein phosphatase PrpC
MAPQLLKTNPVEPVACSVDGPADARRSTELAASFAALLGFPPADCAEIALVVAELASNVVQHASGGTVKLSRIEGSGHIGLQIESEDSGPGISDLEQAVTDGYSTAGSLGIGLGTVNRLTDELEAYSRPERGVRIVCQRWLRPRMSDLALRDLSFGVATRSYRRLPHNGDAFVVKQWGRNAIAGVIDGLGHGQFAQRASQTARQYIEQHFDQPLENLFRGVGRACRGTRGVVMTLARFELDRQKVTIASVGDVDARLIGCPERVNLVVRRGIIGLNAPSPVPSEHPWTSTSLLVIHSDGLRPQWAWNEFSHLARGAPDMIARRLLQSLGKMDDDATVVVARNSDS